MSMAWYFVVPISIVWITANIVYLYLGRKAATSFDKPVLKTSLLEICLSIGMGVLYLSWPVVVLLFDLVPLFLQVWMVASVFCCAVLVLKNNSFKAQVIKAAIEDVKEKSKIPALIYATFLAGLMMVFSPVLLALECI